VRLFAARLKVSVKAKGDKAVSIRQDTRHKSCPTRHHVPKFVIRPISTGIGPAKRLLWSERKSIERKLPKVDGIVPVNLLSLKLSDSIEQE